MMSTIWEHECPECGETALYMFSERVGCAACGFVIIDVENSLIPERYREQFAADYIEVMSRLGQPPSQWIVTLDHGELVYGPESIKATAEHLGLPQ